MPWYPYIALGGPEYACMAFMRAAIYADFHSAPVWVWCVLWATAMLLVFFEPMYPERMKRREPAPI